MIKEGFLRINTLKIHYILFERDKKFPAVFLIHPFVGSLYNWTFNFHSLSRNFKVVAFDLPGFGYSNSFYLPFYSIDLFVEVLKEIMEKMKIEKASLVGNSLGGQVSAFFAIKYPEKVEKLVLVDSAGVTPLPEFFREFLKSIVSSGGPFIKFFRPPKFLIRAIINLHFYEKNKKVERFSEDIIEYIYSIDYYKFSKVIYQVAYTVLDNSLRGNLHRIKSPSLIIWGRQDPLFPFCNAIYFAKNIKNSKLVIIDKCGHFPNIEKSVEFNKIVNEFLS